jgi:hypothetical protein
MESNNKDLRDRDDLRSEGGESGEPLSAANQPLEAGAAEEEHNDEHRKHRHHEEHHINRKYRPFSNHSSNDDIPHTNTSF